MGAKSASNVIKNIDRSRYLPMPRVITALGIRFVGERTAEILAEHFGTMEKICDSGHRRSSPYGGGSGTSESRGEYLYSFFREPQNQLLIDRLKNSEPFIGIYGPDREKDGPLNGMTFVLTGTLPGMSREEAKYKIEAAGGKVASVVTRKTTYTVAGEEAGSKLDKAKSLKIKIIGEAELRAMLPAG